MTGRSGLEESKPMSWSKSTALVVGLFLLPVSAHPALAEAPPFLPVPAAAALAQELSGELAKRNLEFLSRQHRMRGSRGFSAAAEFIAGELRGYGLKEVEVVAIPADGEIFYGTQRSRRPWDVEFAELWELRQSPEGSEAWAPARRIASWDAVPLSLAQDSESGAVTADLVAIGAGTAESDYQGREVRGRLVLTSSQPEAVVALAVDRFGAAGIVSYAQNQRTAWWGEDETLIRWGHLGSFNAKPAFAFMVSPETARGFERRLGAGESVRLQATVRAGQHAGAYQVVSGVIPGADPGLRAQEIVFSCHLDHPRPGANDNASGCATILEVARSVAKLLAEGKVERPARTLRFLFPPEIEGTMAWLHHRPESAVRTRAAIHLDMVGGGPVTKSVFHVTRGPASLPSFVHDVAAALGAFVNRESMALAATGSAEWPLTAAEGGKEPLQAELADYSAGSDHDVWNEASFGVPAIYFNDWPDRYIHTTGDVPANIDPTKLKRAGFLAAASALVLADLDSARAEAMAPLLRAQSLRRLSELAARSAGLPAEEAAASARFWLWHEREVAASVGKFLDASGTERVASPAPAILAAWSGVLGTPPPAPTATGDGALVFARRGPKGPLSVFGYDYLQAHLGAERYAALKLLQLRSAHGGDYAYQALNLVDGARTAAGIRDALSAIYGTLPLEPVVEYLRALESIGIVAPVP